MKVVRKILPLSIYDVSGIESWLEKQADAGLFPVSLNSWATFTRNGVPGTRFRLVVKVGKGGPITLEQLELFRESGWHYVCSVSRIYDLFYTTDPEAVEVYSDWESRGFSLEPLKKRIISYRRRRWILFAALAAVVIWAVFFFESPYDIQPDHFARLVLVLLNLFQPAPLLFLACVIWIWRLNSRDWRLLQRMYKALSQGLPPPASKGPSKAMVWDQIILIALTLMLVVAVVISRFDILNPWENISLDRFSKPYITIQTIEQEPVLPWEELFEEEPVEGKPENYAEQKFSLLAPTWYRVVQEAYSTQSGSQPNYFSPKPENGTERYAPDLDATYFELLLPALARPVAKAQMDAYRLVNLNWSYTELSDTGLDFAIYATETDGIWQMLAIGKENRVAVFRYAGREQLPDHLQELSETVN